MSNLKVTIRAATQKDCTIIADFNCRLADESEGKRLDPETVQAGVQALLNDYPAADTRAHDDTKYAGHVPTGAEQGFCQGKTVGIVFNANRPVKADLEIVLKRSTDQALGI